MLALRAYVEITRPVNSLLVGFAVLVGVAVVAVSKVTSASAILGFLTGFLLTGYAMVVNDFYDLEVDRVNSPHRPLPSGRIKVRSALGLAGTLLLLGLAAAWLTSVANFFVATAFAALAWIYNYWGKRKGLVGNMMVAASVAVPYIYGGMVAAMPGNLLIWVLALISFLAATGREVVKTIADIPGDTIRRVRSVAISKGSRAAASLGAALFLLAVLLTPIPLLLGAAGIVYGTLVLIPNAIFVYGAVKILREHSPETARAVKKIALIGMLTGLVAFVLGGALRA